jgi:hypothetical protein
MNIELIASVDYQSYQSEKYVVRNNKFTTTAEAKAEAKRLVNSKEPNEQCIGFARVFEDGRCVMNFFRKQLNYLEAQRHEKDNVRRTVGNIPRRRS